MEKRNAWLSYDGKDIEQVSILSDGYKHFLDNGKTERECVTQIIAAAESNGYVPLESKISSHSEIKPGDRILVNQMGKAVLLFNIGSEPLENGMNIIGSHIDSPRLDVKQNPFYEDSGFAYADTHYYGGIKKYQWVARALALHGVIVKKDLTKIDLVIGEDENDPVVGITDLLIHLSKEQLESKLREAIKGESLDITIGGKPAPGDDKNAVLSAVLELIKDKCGIEEQDMLSAEIEAVPAEKARDFGLDRSMILAYGHDDRVCAYASLQSILALDEIPQRTSCCMFVDKEEIGSVGATGMRARYFENAVAELIATGKNYSELTLRRCLANSSMLSCDVSAGYDPLYSSAFEKKNAAELGCGVCYNKFTGSGGKSGSNDANAEYLGKIRLIMDRNDISWQTAELGKVDVGGGGTIAYICALYGMNVVDSGVAVLNMHAPLEIIDKADLYEAFRAYRAFLTEA